MLVSYFSEQISIKSLHPKKIESSQNKQKTLYSSGSFRTSIHRGTLFKEHASKSYRTRIPSCKWEQEKEANK